MAKATIYGLAFSTYVRAARLACLERGIEHDLVEVRPQSPELLAVNPIGKMPVLKIGDVLIYETLAIMDYVNSLGSGPALFPADPLGRARVLQLVSMFNDSVNPHFFAIALNRMIRPMMLNEPCDEAAVQAAIPKLRRGLEVLDKFSAGDWLAGGAMSAADLFLAPALFYLPMMQLDEPLMSGLDRLKACYGRVAERPSFAATQPQFG